MNKTSRQLNNETIDGIIFPAIIDNANYWLTQIVVYADGLIACWSLVDFDEFKAMVNSGKILVSIPENSELHIPDWGKIQVSNFESNKTANDFIKEVEDAVMRLNGKKDRIEVCRDLFKEYLLDPSEPKFAILKLAFDDLPTHQKVIIDMVDYKDPLIGLMVRNETFTKEEREYILNDYFGE